MRSKRYLLLTVPTTLFVVLALAGCGGGGTKAPESLKTIAKNKEVHALSEAMTAPFEYGEGTGVQGMGADVGEAIAKDIGQPLKWVKSKGVSHLFDVLKEGTTVDMIISSVIKDPQRAEFDFSEPYYETGDVIAHSRTEFGITDLASLSGKKVGVAEGHPADFFMATPTTAPGATISRYPTIDDALGALNRKEIDAVVGDEILVSYSVVNSYKNTNILPTLVNKYSYAVAVRKGDAEFLKKINETISRLKSSGELDKLVEKWKVNEIRKEAQEQAAGDRLQDELKRAPKTISVSINKQSGNWAMDRLDGFVFVLNGANGSYRSTPILTEGNHGTCRFTAPVPPGDYSLNISILGLTAKVTVPELPKSALAMSVNIANGVSISLR